MKTDTTYCNNTTCLHRAGCSRNLMHYTVLDGIRLSVFDGEDCINVPDDEMPYRHMIRFRNSDALHNK